MIFYFTATGNSLYIAKRLGNTLLSIPKENQKSNNRYEDKSIGFVFPCYYFGTPKLVKKFIKDNEFKADYYFAIMTYGNFSAAGINDFDKLVKKQGVNLSYTNEIKMVDNYLPLFDIKDQVDKTDNKKIDEKISKINYNIKNKNKFKLKKNILLKLLTGVSQYFYKKFNNFDSKFYVNENCTTCGICKRVCPVDNIIIKKKPVYKNNCERCLACIHICPENAIHMRNQKSDARYINPNIDPDEIINSNI